MKHNEKGSAKAPRWEQTGQFRASPKGLRVRMFREAGEKPKHGKPCRLRYKFRLYTDTDNRLVVTRGEGKERGGRRGERESNTW